MTINAFSEHHLTHPKYRPDIDGLRAIAILSVVGFHAFPNWINGGFIGVDIFFVISGYLISSIIFDSLEHNHFSFFEFYSRRIKRIFPALILVLIACFAFGWFVLLADEYKQLGKHIAGGAGFIANFIFWNESGYFDNASDTKPLLHLWSLGVEEQFYIAWPVLLWFDWKQRLNMLTIVIAVGIISFALNIARINGGHTVAAFYSPQTRFWELLTGSLLAYATLRQWNSFPKLKHWLDTWLGKLIYSHPPEGDGRSLRNIQSLLGAALIAVGVFVIAKENHFPGWWAVLPTLGTVMIIAAGMQAWLNSAVLGNRMLVWFGLISFPLYLWHWPLLSFARIVESETPSHEI
jgi:peptidoglycan/LPS O-acetylase OafA/YrhL